MIGCKDSVDLQDDLRELLDRTAYSCTIIVEIVALNNIVRVQAQADGPDGPPPNIRIPSATQRHLPRPQRVFRAPCGCGRVNSPINCWCSRTCTCELPQAQTGPGARQSSCPARSAKRCTSYNTPSRRAAGVTGHSTRCEPRHENCLRASAKLLTIRIHNRLVLGPGAADSRV